MKLNLGVGREKQTHVWGRTLTQALGLARRAGQPLSQVSRLKSQVSRSKATKGLSPVKQVYAVRAPPMTKAEAT